ncbi:MAG: hypothetical protein ACREYE_11575, partial [Gammaproteobacteria bacterium]
RRVRSERRAQPAAIRPGTAGNEATKGAGRARALDSAQRSERREACRSMDGPGWLARGATGAARLMQSHLSPYSRVG